MSVDLLEALEGLLTKRCCKCGDTKPLPEFHRDRSNRDGRQARCKPCQQEAVKESEARNRDRMGDKAYEARRKGQRDAWRKANRDRIAAYNAAMAEVRDLHRDEFDAIYERERQSRGLS